MKEKRWFEQDKDGIRHVINFLSPYENITVGSSPLDGMMLETAQKYDIFVNVSSPPQYSLSIEKPSLDARYYWFPLGEIMFWGYEPFFWSKKVLDEHHDQGHHIYLHCEAGVNRSPSIAMAWLTSRGHSLEEAAEIAAGGHQKLAKWKLENFQRNVDHGHIPDNLDMFYERMNDKAAYGNLLETMIHGRPQLLPFPEKFLKKTEPKKK